MPKKLTLGREDAGGGGRNRQRSEEQLWRQPLPRDLDS